MPEAELAPLTALVGDWRLQGALPGDGAPTIRGSASFAWLDGERFLVQRWHVEPPEFPDGIAIIGADGAGGLVQHYFDARGIARRYALTVDAEGLRLERDDEDFAQRYTGRFEDSGARIAGRWERCDDGVTWEHDFDLDYVRAR